MGATLTDEDHNAMDAFLTHTFDHVRGGALTRDQFIEHMAYVLTALDIGNRAEAVWYFKTGMFQLQLAGERQKPAVPAIGSTSKCSTL